MQDPSPNTDNDCEVTFNIDAKAFLDATAMRVKRGLACGWGDLIYDGFHNVWPYCPLSMKRNYLSSRSNQTKTPYWTAIANCKTSQCIQVKFIIQDKPAVDATTVPVKAKITGRCRHVGPVDASTDVTVPNRRQLAGGKRHRRDTFNWTNSVYYIRKLGETSKTECIAGNTTPCQTPAVVRQAIYERHKANEWHEQPIYELEIQRRTWVASMPGVHLSGYIQKIVFYPFQVLFYLEDQVKTLNTTPNSTDR